MTKPSFPLIWKSAEVVLPMQRSELCRQRGRKNTKTGLWNKSYISKYCLFVTGNCYLLGPTCKVNFGGVYHVNNHPHMKVLMFLMRFSRSFTPTQRSFRAFCKFIYIFAFQTDIFGALKGVRYTPELSWQYFIKDSLHLTRFFFEMGGSGPPVHTRMDSQHKVEHPKVSRNRGFCSDLDQGDVNDEIYQYVSLVFLAFIERPV